MSDEKSRQAALNILLEELPAILRQDDTQLAHWRAITDQMLAEWASDAQQAIRYYKKRNNLLRPWESLTEYEKGVSVTCDNLEQLVGHHISHHPKSG